MSKVFLKKKNLWRSKRWTILSLFQVKSKLTAKNQKRQFLNLVRKTPPQWGISATSKDHYFFPISSSTKQN